MCEYINKFVYYAKKYLDKHVRLKKIIKRILNEFPAIRSKLLIMKNNGINDIASKNDQYIPPFDKEAEAVFLQLIQNKEMK